MAIAYALAQFVGSVIGFGLLKLLTPTKIFAQSSTEYGVCQTYPNEEMDNFGIFSIEYLSTMFWILMFCAVWDPRSSSQQNSSMPIIFGSAITVFSLIFVSEFVVIPYIESLIFKYICCIELIKNHFSM